MSAATLCCAVTEIYNNANTPMLPFDLRQHSFVKEHYDIAGLPFYFMRNDVFYYPVLTLLR